MKLKKLKIKRKIYHTIKIIFSLLLIITLLFQILGFSLQKIGKQITHSSSTSLNKPVSFLLMGADFGGNREFTSANPARVDSNVIVTLNPNNERGNIDITTISIPRDTRMPIVCANNKEEKMNFSLGEGALKNNDLDEGIDCSVKTIEQYFNINIDYYLFATFDSFIKLINSIDGITINIPYAFSEQDSKGNKDSISFEKGMQHLDGEQALAYARMRHAINPETGLSGDDFERNIRQQEIIMAVINKIFSNPSKYLNDSINFLLKDLHTNLNIKILLQIANFITTTTDSIKNTLANHQSFNLITKNQYGGRLIGINPYDDVFNTTSDDTTNQTMNNIFYDNENSDRIDYTDTLVTIIPINYRRFNVPSVKVNDELNKPQNIEFMMNTLTTTGALDGTGDELVSDTNHEYFSTILQANLNQLDSN